MLCVVQALKRACPRCPFQFQESPANQGGAWVLPPQLNLEAMAGAVQDGRQYEYGSVMREAQQLMQQHVPQHAQQQHGLPYGAAAAASNQRAGGQRGAGGAGAGFAAPQQAWRAWAPGNGDTSASAGAGPGASGGPSPALGASSSGRLRPTSASMVLLSPYARRAGKAEAGGATNGSSTSSPRAPVRSSSQGFGGVTGGWMAGPDQSQHQSLAAEAPFTHGPAAGRGAGPRDDTGWAAGSSNLPRGPAARYGSDGRCPSNASSAGAAAAFGTFDGYYGGLGDSVNGLGDAMGSAAMPGGSFGRSSVGEGGNFGGGVAAVAGMGVGEPWASTGGGWGLRGEYEGRMQGLEAQNGQLLAGMAALQAQMEALVRAQQEQQQQQQQEQQQQQQQQQQAGGAGTGGRGSAHATFSFLTLPPDRGPDDAGAELSTPWLTGRAKSGDGGTSSGNGTGDAGLATGGQGLGGGAAPGQARYEVVVSTSDVEGAGTDSRLFLTLLGEGERATREVPLRSDRSPAFQRGQVRAG